MAKNDGKIIFVGNVVYWKVTGFMNNSIIIIECVVENLVVMESWMRFADRAWQRSLACRELRQAFQSFSNLLGSVLGWTRHLNENGSEQEEHGKQRYSKWYAKSAKCARQNVSKDTLRLLFMLITCSYYNYYCYYYYWFFMVISRDSLNTSALISMKSIKIYAQTAARQ